MATSGAHVATSRILSWCSLTCCCIWRLKTEVELLTSCLTGKSGKAMWMKRLAHYELRVLNALEKQLSGAEWSAMGNMEPLPDSEGRGRGHEPRVTFQNTALSIVSNFSPKQPIREVWTSKPLCSTLSLFNSASCAEICCDANIQTI